MKTIYFLRHAEAESSHEVSDESRDLTPAGVKQADELAEYLSQQKLPIDIVMCSSAIRTQETLDHIRDSIACKQFDVSPQYYNINEDDILHFIQGVDDSNESILYIGHNPGITFAAFKMEVAPSTQLARGMDPCTLVGMTLPIQAWVDTRFHMATEMLFWRPQSNL